MGKRKSKARVMKKAVATVATVFSCPFCNHNNTVECKLNYNTNLGLLKCRVCSVNYQMEINHLTEPIDIYSEWIDETEKINKINLNKQDDDDEEEDDNYNYNNRNNTVNRQ